MRVGVVLVLAAVCGASAADAERGMLVRRDMVFDSYSPLARGETLLSRLMTPLRRERVHAGAVASGIAISESSIDLANERFSLYVPAGAAPPAGYGLLVFVPPWERAAIPPDWLAVLARHRFIAVTAAKSGNGADVIDRRIPLALSGYDNASKRYPLDPARVYVGGFSGGSRVALRIALAFPDVFDGALLNAGSDPIGSAAVALPDATLFRLFEQRSRLVYATGSEDAAALVADANSRDSARDLCFSDTVTLTMRGRGHEPSDPATLDDALDELDAPRKSAPDIGACRAVRNKELARQFAGVGKRIDAGDLPGAARQLGAIDEHFGGLAAPTSIEFARRLAALGAWPTVNASTPRAQVAGHRQ